MDRSSPEIETLLPDVGGCYLDELAGHENRILRQVRHRLAREATRLGSATAGFTSSA
ncbi:FXSXX-COOH protein [Frankia sp. CcI49]|uniref:FXSXX-COOH protein n=1 Tax=Parafrankia irregularis TaxID=795642 RepID=A0A0S4QS43_9ACTN|nr:MULTISPECIES: FxSxx-COOH cyclophane-containing RiPP peptide [Frankiaceae]MBE3205935.1 FXSXX-COOH protein [Parafrankia sp. CH37]ONH59875.1 FXSXX-COOH protein [Frankia sp. CcI49]CUU58116.1 FXSXX-COOH protein [Parafrankia irregularis]